MIVQMRLVLHCFYIQEIDFSGASLSVFIYYYEKVIPYTTGYLDIYTYKAVLKTYFIDKENIKGVYNVRLLIFLW